MSHQGSDFLVISDPSWIQIDNATEIIQSSQMGEFGLQDLIARTEFNSIDTLLEDAGIMPIGYTVMNATLVRAAADDLRLWVQYFLIPQNPGV